MQYSLKLAFKIFKVREGQEGLGGGIAPLPPSGYGPAQANMKNEMCRLIAKIIFNLTHLR